MKHLSKAIALFAMSAFVFTSCVDESTWNGISGDQGAIHLELSSDGRVLMNTRADDSKVSVIPNASQFAISFEKQDGSFTKKWANVDAFNKESSFPIGTYTLSATYGDLEKEGFELPYFRASQDVIVESGVESHVHLTASLNNAMVSIRYTDDFKNRFSAYSASLKSASSAEWVMFAQNEDRPAYMKPEAIDLRLSLTNGQGKNVDVAPYSFIAQPQHHYIVTLGINDEKGVDNIHLDVQISEEVESEFIDISLGDDLFNAPAPILKASGFPENMSYDEFRGFIVTGEPKIDVLSYGGLSKVTMTVETATPLAFGNSVQFVNADNLLQQQIQGTGLVAEGFYRNADKAGVLKFKEFLSNLPEGTYKFRIEAQDARTIFSETPIEFSATIKKVNATLAVVKHPEYMGTEMTVSVTTNQPDMKNNIRFEVKNAAEDWIQADILSQSAAVRTRSGEDYVFTYRIGIPTVEHYDVNVRAFYRDETEPKAEIIDEGVIFPEYSLEIDAFAQRALIKVVPADASKLGVIYNNLKLCLNGKEISHSQYNVSEGIVELTGLEANTEYTKYETYLSFIDNPHKNLAAFTTEAATDVKDGGFSDVEQTINFSNVNVGGKWRRTALATHQTTTSIVRSTPNVENDWATVNDLTCYKGAKNKNTWFIVPSTFENNGEIVIQTVGYSHNGTDPDTSGGTAEGVKNYYCKNSPSDSELSKASGELFLGKFSYDGQEHRSDGILWNTRPTSLSFQYTYTSYNNDKGEAYITVYDEDATIISSGRTLISDGVNQEEYVILSAYPFGRKAAKLVLGFRSTCSDNEATVHIPTGSELYEGEHGVSLNTYKTRTNEYSAVALGSKLVIDKVKLNYTTTPAQLNVKRRAVVSRVMKRK